MLSASQPSLFEGFRIAGNPSWLLTSSATAFGSSTGANTIVLGDMNPILPTFLLRSALSEETAMALAVLVKQRTFLRCILCTSVSSLLSVAGAIMQVASQSPAISNNEFSALRSDV